MPELVELTIPMFCNECSTIFKPGERLRTTNKWDKIECPYCKKWTKVSTNYEKILIYQ